LTRHPLQGDDTAPAAERRPRARLALEIAVVLAVKFTALAVIWNLWFADPASRHVDARAIGAAVYGAPQQDAQGGARHARP
jgi:hypothetical protein